MRRDCGSCEYLDDGRCVMGADRTAADACWLWRLRPGDPDPAESRVEPDLPGQGRLFA